MVQREPEGQM